MPKGTTWLGESQTHFEDSHRRWLRRLNRNMTDPSYKDEWAYEQCFSCIYFVPLTGRFKSDYGACTNPKSPFDGRVMFEHDGCDYFVQDAKYWGDDA
jgi:hypothetical protein